MSSPHDEAERAERSLSTKRRLVGNTALNAIAQSASMVAAFIFMPLLVQSFGMADYGVYILVSAVLAYAALLDLGIGTALTKTVAHGETAGDRSETSGAVATALTFYSVVGVLVAVAMALIGLYAGAIFHITPSGALLLRNLLLVGAVFQLWAWPASTARHVLAGLQRYDVLAATGLATTLLGVAATIYVLRSGEGPLMLLVLTGAAAALTSGVNVWFARSRSGVRGMRPTGGSFGHLRAMLVFSWAAFVVQLSDVLFYQQTDRLILGVLAGAIAVGLYEASAKVNGFVTYLSGLSVSAVLPLASGMDARGEHASLRSLFVRGTKYGALLIAPVAVVVVVFAAPLLAVWLGPEYSRQSAVMQVLVFPHVLVCLGLMGDAIVISRGRMGPRVPWILAQAVLNVALSMILVPRIGVMGVAVGTAVAHIADFPIHIRFLLKETGVSFRQWLHGVVAPVYPLLVIPILVGIGYIGLGLAGSLLGVGIGALLALAAYWLAVYFMGLTTDEREDFGRVARSIGRRSRPQDQAE